MTMCWVLPKEQVDALLNWADMPRHIWDSLTTPHRIACVNEWLNQIMVKENSHA